MRTLESRVEYFSLQYSKVGGSVACFTIEDTWMFIMIWGLLISIILIKIGIFPRSLWLLQQYFFYFSIFSRCILKLEISYSKKVNFFSRIPAYCTALLAFLLKKIHLFADLLAFVSFRDILNQIANYYYMFTVKNRS